ncbi:hypothetical protein L499_A1140 [Bordetella holmesii CDC-H635-BH]|uniref:Uncharacterized protein n=2 Tax=Bordetella holmesii TaxID=35814 RepID=A0A158M874_9BORD|nr:hypothetical protein D559_1386 [Bordetella holmesii 1058]KAK81132.1 hypothetical protein L503_1129 [Bordetella holmesii CDC-H809-BH]KAK87602.1 hypothetical protein L496_1110 [Bordetella holmesii CDC-H572-BH]KAK89623.1 hypothetical protein L573_1153 [Bordetella holmesii H620]KAK98747.1 hypothetical protein L497_1092 [Bordetella holmesii CDC-H585-BH]KAL03143.1 hypothetical protein L499_A1140 [Bordetella holmesii CDC-H635-BH]KCV01870.1 hypothetical protein L501_1121 [Bordetella holmesii CDC-H
MDETTHPDSRASVGALIDVNAYGGRETGHNGVKCTPEPGVANQSLA